MVRFRTVRSRSAGVLFAACVGGACLGCSGTSVEKAHDVGPTGEAGAGDTGGGGSGAGGSGGGGSGTGGVGAGGTSTGGSGAVGGFPPELDALCSAPDGVELTFLDEDDAAEKLTGRWVLCSGPGLEFAAEQTDQAGVELTADKQWYVLDATGNGGGDGLDHATGFFASGTYRFQPPQELEFGPSPTALLFMGADYSFVNVRMLDSPRKMRFEFSSFSGEPSIYAFIEPRR